MTDTQRQREKERLLARFNRRQEARREFLVSEWRGEEERKALSTATLGAAQELLAAANLIRRGYDVFRAVSPAAPCDLIALKGGLVLRVEVRTAVVTATGRVTSSKPNPLRNDVVARVLSDGRVDYRPALPRTIPNTIPVSTCACGCGGRPRFGKFILHHNNPAWWAKKKRLERESVSG